MRKKRILFVSEASYLSTGYATYSREVLSRLHQSNKYELAEFSIYGQANDPKRKTIPWMNYPNMPDPNDKEANKIYRQDGANQFGKWRFERVCIDFKPDIVLLIRDYWMDSFIQHSPVRKYFNCVWMPTVDSPGQNEEWLDAFQDPEIVLTYSDWAIDELKAGSDSINVKCAATPSASEDYSQVPDKGAHKKAMGLNPDWKIIGTVMRNQRRKLFPDLFKGFGNYLKETGDKNSYLYCHTSYPDNGWDLPKYMMQEEIMSRTLFTYVCTQCNKVSCHKFSDAAQPCDKCNNLTSKLSSVSNGVNTATLNAIYNLFDLYIQPISAEGFGIPIVEAAACGVPIVVTDHSAPHSELRKLNGIPLRSRTIHLEMETGCYRSLPDIDHMSSIFKSFLSKPEQLRAIEGRKTREAFEKNFSWDKTAKVWEECIEELGYGRWDDPVSLCNPEIELPELHTNKELLDFILMHMLNEPHLVNSYTINKLIRDLNFNMFKNNPGGFFYGELSIFNREDYKPLNREMVVSMFREKTINKLFWENARLGNVQFKEEDWLCRR